MTEPLPPPIPPKPFHPQSIPEFNLTNPAEVNKPPLLVESSNGRPSSPTDEDELTVALALSQSESIQRKLREEALATQEEEELARALAESMLSTGRNLTEDHNPFFSEAAPSMSRIYENQSSPETTVHSSSFESSNVSPSFVSHAESFSFSNGGLTELGRYENWRTPGMSRRSSIETEVELGKRSDFEAPSQNPSQTPGGIDIPPEYRKGGHEISSFPEKSSPNDRGSTSQHQQTEEYLTIDGEFRHTSSVVIPDPYSASGKQNESSSYGESINISDDEAFARRLAAEEEAAAHNIPLHHPVALGSLAPDVTGTNIEAESPTELPYYYADNTSSRNYSDTTTADATPHPEPSLTVTARTYPSPPTHTSSASNLPAEDSQSIPLVSSDFSGTQHRPDPQTSSISPQISQPPIPEAGDNNSRNPASSLALASPPPVVNPNHFIDAELLLGVCKCSALAILFGRS